MLFNIKSSVNLCIFKVYILKYRGVQKYVYSYEYMKHSLFFFELIKLLW